MVSGNIEIDTGKDKVISTVPPYRINMSNVEVASEPAVSGAPRVEIPEKRRREAIDSGSDGSDYAFLANPKKLTAPKVAIPEVKDADGDSDSHGKYNSDSDSGRSRRSVKSTKSHHSARSKRSENSEYKPRYTIPEGSRTDFPRATSSPPLMNSMF